MPSVAPPGRGDLGGMMRIVVEPSTFPLPRSRRRAAPRNSAAGAASSHNTPRARARQGSRSIPAVVQPCTPSGPSYGDRSSPRTTSGTFASHSSKSSSTSARAERRVVIEVDVRHDRDERSQSGWCGRIRRPRRQATRSGRRFRELRDVRSDHPRRFAAETLEADAIIRFRRRLAVRPGNHVESRSETGWLGARLASSRNAPGKGPSDFRLPAFRRNGWVAEISTWITQCWRYGVSKRSPPHTSAPHACEERAGAHARPPIPAIAAFER